MDSNPSGFNSVRAYRMDIFLMASIVNPSCQIVMSGCLFIYPPPSTPHHWSPRRSKWLYLYELFNYSIADGCESLFTIECSKKIRLLSYWYSCCVSLLFWPSWGRLKENNNQLYPSLVALYQSLIYSCSNERVSFGILKKLSVME